MDIPGVNSFAVWGRAVTLSQTNPLDRILTEAVVQAVGAEVGGASTRAMISTGFEVTV
jgi:hypothetical protein